MNTGPNPKRHGALRRIPAVAALVCAACCLPAQTPAPAPSQQQQTDKQQNPPPAQANPFPEDTNNVPVLPNGKEAAPAPPPAAAEAPPTLPGDDVDPVRSPDEPPPSAAPSSFGSSSSSADLANIIAPPPDEDTGKSSKNKEVPEHKETAKEDESVGEYYLGQKNWRAALSRYQSALVLDPENPDVYWGLAESQRHLGDLANAKANYMKVMEYDPDSKHAKDAKKLLKEPEMAKAAASAPTQK